MNSLALLAMAPVIVARRRKDDLVQEKGKGTLRSCQRMPT